MTAPVSITTLFPRPREVTLGGRTFLVGEMRLADMVDLQGFLDDRWDDPLAAIRPALAGMDEADRKKALRGVYDACEAGPARWGTEAGWAILATAEGIVETFRLCLRWHNPAMSYEEVVAVAEKTAPDEFAALKAAWYRPDPADEVLAMLGLDDGERGGPIGWAQAVCELCETYGWTLEYARSLTLGQIGAARGCGKPRERGVAAAPGSVRQKQAEVRARMNGGANGNGVHHGG